jgi:two-component system alkaline phosphatase synthesis response regulator PhoP
MASQRILVIEDEEDIAELVRYNLEAASFTVTCVTNGEDGLRAARSDPPDLILLDLMLPGLDGLEVCRRLRADASTVAVPIIMVTAKGEESDIIAGLELGADDYVPKPFSPRVLVARVRSILRRPRQDGEPQPSSEDDSIVIDELEIRPGRHEVLVGGERVEFTNTEFRILHFLACRRGWVFTRYQIVDGIRGEGHVVTERSVDVQIVALRRKLNDASRFIETVRGVGYRFRGEQE